MGFSLFKKTLKEEPKPVEIEVEKPVYSRFKFAYDDGIEVVKYYLDTKNQVDFSSLAPNTVFVINNGIDLDDGSKVYPVFRMPNEFPKTKPVSFKKIFCIGTLHVSNEGEIIEICGNGWIAKTFEEIIAIYDLDCTCNVIVMNYDDAIIRLHLVDDIELETFERYLTIKNSLRLVTN